MGEPIRVLCVFAKLDRGGAESMCMNLYRNIDRSQVQFDFVKHTSSVGVFEKEIRSLGGKIYQAPQFELYNYLSYQKWWSQHLRAHPEHQIIHGHFYTISPVYFREAHRFGRITIGHSHSTAQRSNNIKTYLKKVIQRRTEKYSDYCLACSQDAGEWLFPHSKFIVLNNAIDAQRFKYNPVVGADVRSEIGLNGNIVVGVVGRLTEPKNPMGTIEIFKAVHDRKPETKLLWVGGGSLEQDIRKKLEEEKLTDAVIMTGVRPDVDRLMQAMDVFILPSLWEGLPVVLVEAQAAGLPCFASEAVSREAAVTDLCTFLPLNQPELWAEKILAANTQRKDTSQEIIQAGYDIHTTAKWLEEFYMDCLK